MGLEDMMLFWGSGSSPCMRVMIALEEKGFNGFPQKRLDFGKKEHKGQEVIDLNPRGTLPTFKDGEIVFTESYGIVHYLQHRYPDSGTNLLPGDAKQQALVLQRYYEAQGMLSSKYSTWFRTVFYQQDAVKGKELADGLLAELLTFNGYLGQSAFVAGDSFSLADIEMMAFLTMVERQGLKLEGRFDNVKAYYERNKERPSMLASYPPHFKTSDAPNKMADY